MALESLDRSGFAPLYHQLYATLRDQILAGTYAVGDVLPSERDLAKRFAVSRITAQKAVEQLAAEQFIRREQGRGSFVTGERSPPPISANMQGLIDNVIALGAATTGRIISLANEVPSAEVREAMQLGAREKVQRSVHLRLLDDAPLGIITTHVPLDIARTISAKDIEATPMLALLEARGIAPSWARQSIGAVTATREQSRALTIAIGAPLVRLTRMVYASDDRPVEHLAALYRSDRYEYRTLLRRGHPSQNALG